MFNLVKLCRMRYHAGSDEGSPVDLTTAQAAKELGVSTRRVRQYIEEGRLKATKAGRDYLISRRSLAAFKPQSSGRPTSKEQS